LDGLQVTELRERRQKTWAHRFPAALQHFCCCPVCDSRQRGGRHKHDSWESPLCCEGDRESKKNVVMCAKIKKLALKMMEEHLKHCWRPSCMSRVCEDVATAEQKSLVLLPNFRFKAFEICHALQL